MRRWTIVRVLSVDAKCWGVLVATAIALLNRRALAEPTLPTVVDAEWIAPPECPPPSAVRASIATLLRESTSDRSASPSWFRAHVTHDRGLFRMEVQTGSPMGGESKSVVGDSCATLAEAFALIVAFAVDPHLSRPPRGPEPERPEPSPVPAPATPSPPAPPGTSIRPLRWALGAVGSASAGNLPFPGFGLGALVTAGERPRVELSGLVWPSQQRTLSGSERAIGVSVNLLTARPSLCVPFAASAFEVCASAEVGRMQGTGTGSITLDSGQSWWVAVGAGVTARARVSAAYHVRLRLDVGVPLLRPTFVVDRPAGPRELWQPSAVFVALSVSPEFVLSSTEAQRVGHDQ